MAEITKYSNGAYYIDDKELYVPFKLKTKCKKCNTDIEIDYFNDRPVLIEQPIGAPIKADVYCNECGHDDTITLKVYINVSIVTENEEEEEEEE